MKGKKKLARLLLIIMIIVIAIPFKNILAFAEPDNYKDKFEEVHIRYDETITKFNDWNDSYPYEAPLREIIKTFDIKVHPDEKVYFEGSGSLPVEHRYGFTSIGGSGTLKLEGDIVYDEVTGYPSVKGILSYTADVTEKNTDLKQTIQWKVNCSGEFFLGLPMSEVSESIFSYGGALTDTDKNLVTKIVTDDDGESSVNESEDGYFGLGYTFKSNTTLKGAVSVTTSETEPPEKANNISIDQTIDTEASKTSGETSNSVAKAVVVGITTSVLAAGLGVLAGANNGSSNGEDSKGGTYKMVIYKEFGDSIRYDKPAVVVYARMVEINSEGVEIDRMDLTQKISIFSENAHMKIGPTTIASNYVGATVEAESVKGAESPSEGIVSFVFNGEGGSFCNNVRFKLVGEPYIKFEEQGKNLFMEKVMIEGDNGEYTVLFSLHDFVEIPKVSLKPQDNSPFEVELKKIKDFKYKAIMNNQSVKSEKSSTQRKVFNVEVIAESNTDNISEAFRVAIYPEGISISIIKFDKDGYAQIGAYSDNEKAEVGEEVLATRFKVELVVSSVDEKGEYKAELVDLSKANIKLDNLKGSTVQTENLAKVFKYEIEETTNRGIYKFQPKMQIPEGKTKHYLMLPIDCEYDSKDYHLDLPIRLIGEPFNEMKEKKEELELLLKRIKRYMPPEDWSDVIKHIKENYDIMSPKEIRLLNKSLYEITRIKLLDEAQDNINFAEALDWVIWGLEWVKWVGDQAFSYVAMAYTGPVGEALLSPTKEILVGLISENIWYREGISSPDEKLRGVNGNLMAMLENSLMTQISSDTNIKKAGFILASFTVIKIVNHYYNDVGPDGKPIGFYDAILAGLSDLTSTAFKFVVSEKFDELANNPKAKEYFNKYAGKWVKEALDSNAAGWREKGVEVIKKYVEEICGAGAAKVYTKATQVEFEDKSGRLIININIWDDEKDPNNSIIVSLDVMEIKDKLFDYIFGNMFGNFPFTTSPLNPSADPVFVY